MNGPFVTSGPDQEKLVVGMPTGGHLTDWSPDGRFLLWRSNDRTGDVWIVPLSSGEKPSVKLVDAKPQFGSPQALFKAPPSGFPRRNYEVSPDGQRFLVARPTPGTATITVVTNWQSQITK